MTTNLVDYLSKVQAGEVDNGKYGTEDSVRKFIFLTLFP